MTEIEKINALKGFYAFAFVAQNGDDEENKRILNELKERGVNSDYVQSLADSVDEDELQEFTDKFKVDIMLSCIRDVEKLVQLQTKGD